MPTPRKVKRLVKATQNYENFHRGMDLFTVLFFFMLAVSVADKIVPKKIVPYEWFNPSWSMIGAGVLIFLILVSAQLSTISARRELSAFEKEAALKAARSTRRYRR